MHHFSELLRPFQRLLSVIMHNKNFNKVSLIVSVGGNEALAKQGCTNGPAVISGYFYIQETTRIIMKCQQSAGNSVRKTNIIMP